MCVRVTAILAHAVVGLTRAIGDCLRPSKLVSIGSVSRALLATEKTLHEITQSPSPVWGAPPLWGAPLCGEHPLCGELPWLGWLACCALPWLGLAWVCLACLALAWSSNNNRPPSAAAAPQLMLLLNQAKARQARQARQAQARPSQGKAQQASQPSQGLNPENCQISNFLICHFNPPGSGGRWWPLLWQILYNQVLGRGFMGSQVDSTSQLVKSRIQI